MGNMIRQNFKNKPFSSKSILQKGFRNTFGSPPQVDAPRFDPERLKTSIKKK